MKSRTPLYKRFMDTIKGTDAAEEYSKFARDADRKAFRMKWAAAAYEVASQEKMYVHEFSNVELRRRRNAV